MKENKLFCKLLKCAKLRWRDTPEGYWLTCNEGKYYCKDVFECFYLTSNGEISDSFVPANDDLYKEPLVVVSALIKSKLSNEK